MIRVKEGHPQAVNGEGRPGSDESVHATEHSLNFFLWPRRKLCRGRFIFTTALHNKALFPILWTEAEGSECRQLDASGVEARKE